MHDLLNDIIDKVTQQKEDHLEFFKSLVRANTTDGNEVNGQNIWNSRLKNLRCEIDVFEPDPVKLQKYEEYNEGHAYIDRPNVVATFKGTGAGKSLILNGHMDTVFPSAPQKWSVNPWDPTVLGSRMTGLGSCDMKAGLAALLLAMETIQELKLSLRGDVFLESVVDEEASGGNGTLACLDKGYKADAALVAEPTNLIPMSAHVGSVAFKVTFPGVASHSNLKWEGVNSFEKALPFLNRLRELERKWQAEQSHPLLPKPIISINKVTAGYGPVLVPASCEIQGNFTYLPGGESNVDDFQRELGSAINDDPWLVNNRPVFEWIHNVRPYSSNPQGPWPSCVESTVSDIFKEKTPITGFPSGADARILANVGKMPTVILGPGNIRQAHTVDEFIELEQFHKAIIIYTLMILRWAG